MRLSHFHFKNQNRPLKGTGANRGRFPVAPAESAHMDAGGRRHRRIRPELKVRGAKGAANEALEASIGSEYRVPSPAD